MIYQKRKKALLLLEDGTKFWGKAIGNLSGTSFGEVCFNTGMTGYQEIFTDPSYFGQIMVTTNAHIGNYGASTEEVESDSIKIAGLVCKNFSYNYSRPKADFPLEEFMQQHELLGISDVDTRALVSYIRDNGAMNAVITTEIDNLEEVKEKLAAQPSMKGLELASKVSTQKAYTIGNSDAMIRVAALDLGVKKNILRNLSARNCFIKVFPYNTSFEELNEFEPDGFFLSNGPGDPEPLVSVIETAKKIISSNKPTFGICLGHQIIALAHGVNTFKMHNGHRGINHPVLNLSTNCGEITSQNHGFAVSREALEKNQSLEITHVHLNDNTVAGLKVKDKNCFSVQYHPEASPGPNDSLYLFDQFLENIKKVKS
ncbi:glutamine-hydrolyzing carbamoyl-phosphate synthase small subunit [Mesonia sp. HuA40]|uniref:glutamine-hydrolyzing carbamoyl-phosphate synthase small subunit n=1 Tax=Mesonia sp. HuA40 TaxID=2602761 RepID=UPI0011C84317|nr:glutamine-hydrolyzing carbamoyl-phosphate synthase small subunit [Mesonia sp. HuA40]TXK75297.1 glutamine-hydrolyzing carbamoyl-phosphate synthase small subunit [Mesonia sp. HuA40]